MIIEKKVWPEPFEDLTAGRKKADVRLCDFECTPGDTIVFREYEPCQKRYTGRHCSFEVTHVLKLNDMSYFEPKDIKKYGYQVISLSPIQFRNSE